jgi:hypothetical protein
MKALLEPIKEIARFDELFRDLKKGTAGVTVISGCLESQKAHMIAGLSEDAPVRLLIAENELKAKELYEDYRLYDAGSGFRSSRHFLSGRKLPSSPVWGDVWTFFCLLTCLKSTVSICAMTANSIWIK